MSPLPFASRRAVLACGLAIALAAPVLAQTMPAKEMPAKEMTKQDMAGRAFTAYSPASFKKALMSAEPTIVHVHATWCSVCKAQEGAFSKLTTSDPVFKTAQLVRVDFDTDKAFLREHRVTNQSVIIVFRNGKEVTRLAGESNADRIKAAVSAAAM